ncbi:MAG: ribosomal protein S18-alanine N-acetyltransferase [Deltaproteobacteria bacterium]|nr:ribosomal protein S18-alanine N-acetyltransferase [Deltaproteobacteria bacterium]MBW2137798.1 ribosomal protein S18-alanine N-acetyltransferase [Deltaproteobacteria bacterium]
MSSLAVISQGNYALHIADILEIENLSFPTPWSYESFLEEIRNPVSHLWGIMEDESLSGYACFWIFHSEIQIINIAVHPSKRNRGLAQFLVDNIVKTATFNGIGALWLEVRESNHIAKRIYEKFGFREIHRRRHYYRDTREDAIVMSLMLFERRIAI